MFGVKRLGAVVMQQLVTGEQNHAAHGNTTRSTVPICSNKLWTKAGNIPSTQVRRQGATEWVYLSRMAPSLTTRGCKHARVMCPAVSSALFPTEPFHMGNLSAQHLGEVSVSHLLLAVDAEEVLRVTCLFQDSYNLPDDGLLTAPLAIMEIPDLFQSACCGAGSWAIAFLGG